VGDSIDLIESVVSRHVRRDISRLTAFAKGNLGRAAQSIAGTARPHVGVVAGFYIKHAEPPSPETDGLIGMAHLAAGFRAAGFDVTVITDAPCAKAVWAVVDALPEPVHLEVVGVDQGAVVRLRERLATQASPLTHLVAVERVSPGPDGKPHREHGWDMSRETAPLHLLFEDPAFARPWTTIGIGDGGNEIGMGSLPADIVASDIPNGEVIAAQTPCDHLIVAGVSNWGAYGLLAAVAAARPDLAEALLRHFDTAHEYKFLTAAVETGQAIDDSRVDRLGKPQMSVDRIPVAEHAALVEEIRALVVAA
jgi:vacuolar-type H+-ATPase subunit F/Vma7